MQNNESTQNAKISVRPQIVVLEDAIKKMQAGEWVVPRFQRPFVWKTESMLSLYDSIYKGYPIGSFLIWYPKNEISKTPSSAITPLWELEKIGHHKTQEFAGQKSYIIDGHQRLSTLFGTLIPPVESLSDELEEEAKDEQKNSKWFIYFDLESKQFFHLNSEQTAPIHYFPLNKLLRTNDFRKQINHIFDTCTNKQDAERYTETADLLAYTIRTYQIPITNIEGGDVDDIVDIFTRVNSEGTRMATDYIYSALTFDNEKKFALSENLDTIMSYLEENNFSTLDRNIVFRAFLAVLGEKVYMEIKGKKNIDTFKDEIKKIKEQDLENLFAKFKTSVEHTTEFLKNKIKMPSAKILPHGLQFIAISKFYFSLSDKIITTQQTQDLTKWFWTGSFKGLDALNASIKNKVITELAKYAQTEENKFLQEFTFTFSTNQIIPLPQKFDLNTSRTRAFALYYLSLNPCSLQTGKPIKRFNDKQENVFSFIFESSDFGIIKDKDILRLSVGNRILLEKNYTSKQIVTLLKELPEKFPKDYKRILQSHGILDFFYKKLQNGNAHEFVSSRYNSLKQKENTFAEKNSFSKENTLF